jgi:hypothetical protein
MYEQKMLFEQRFEFAKYSLFDLIEQIQTRKNSDSYSDSVLLLNKITENAKQIWNKKIMIQ